MTTSQSTKHFSLCKAREIEEEAAEKIRNLSQADIPIEKRRALYNQLARRMNNGTNLKAGLVEKVPSRICFAQRSVQPAQRVHD